MSIRFEFRPHSGFGPILLGSLQNEVRASMEAAGFPPQATHGESDYFCGSAVQVEYTDGRATFIGISSCGDFDAVYRGINVFDLPAKEVFDLMAACEPSGAHIFDEYEHYFPDQVMTLWNADTQYDQIRDESRLVWAQVGIGNAEYAEYREKRNES
jgi:hypothetical protein